MLIKNRDNITEVSGKKNREEKIMLLRKICLKTLLFWFLVFMINIPNLIFDSLFLGIENILRF